MLNKYILTSIGIFLLCFMVSCTTTNNNDNNIGTSTNESSAISNEDTFSSEVTTTITTTNITTTFETTQTSYAPVEYKILIENTIVDYENMLMNLNSIVQNFSSDTSWNEELQNCLDISQDNLNAMNDLKNNGTVPKKYSKSHDKIIYCMNHYTEAIKLIQQSVECYLEDDITNGDDYMNQALNRSQLANKVWSQIRGYGIVEYTGETLEPKGTVFSEQQHIIIGDANETFILQTMPETTPQVTYQQYNDGYAFGNDNIYIYTN